MARQRLSVLDFGRKQVLLVLAFGWAIGLLWVIARGVLTSKFILAGFGVIGLIASVVLMRCVTPGVLRCVKRIPHLACFLSPLVGFCALDIYFLLTQSYRFPEHVIVVTELLLVFLAVTNWVGLIRSLDPVARWALGSQAVGFTLALLLVVGLVVSGHDLTMLQEGLAFPFPTSLLMGCLAMIPGIFVGQWKRPRHAKLLIDVLKNGTKRRRRLAAAALSDLVIADRMWAEAGCHGNNRRGLAKVHDDTLSREALSALNDALRDEDAVVRDWASEGSCPFPEDDGSVSKA